MTYMVKFLVNIVTILTLFYVGITLLVTPEKANFSYYIFVILISCIIWYRYIKDKASR